MSETTGIRASVRGLLDSQLPLPRMQTLESACALVAARPLDVTLAELREVVALPLDNEAKRRLHILVSTLYHCAGATLLLTEQLRSEISAATA